MGNTFPFPGEAWMPWCRHDNQHLLNWAVLHTLEYVSMDEQVAWLAKVLEAREFATRHRRTYVDKVAAHRDGQGRAWSG